MSKTNYWIASALMLAPVLAHADDGALIENIPLSATFGAGVVGFVDSETRDFATEGGTWEARIGINSGRMVEFEAAYVGTLQSLDALGLESSAQLLGTGVEGAVRINVLEGKWQPYALAGIGWTRFDITSSDTNTSDVADTDNVAAIPLGIGVGAEFGGVLLDLRGTYRVVTDADLIADQPGGNADLDTWNATFRAGIRF